MTTKERQEVRACLLTAGFLRENGDEPEYYDRGNGVYTEVWRHTKDRTRVDLRWDVKTAPLSEDEEIEAGLARGAALWKKFDGNGRPRNPL